MNDLPSQAESQPQPHIALQVLRFPLVLLVLGFVVIIAAAQLLSALLTNIPLTPFSPIHALNAALVAAIVLIVYRLYVHWVEGQRPADALWRDAWPQLPIGLLLGTVLFSATVLVVWAMGGYEITGTRPFHTLWPLLNMAILSGVLEEILFRGLLFRHVEKMLGSWAALAISALFFGFAHFMNPNSGLLPAVAIALEAGIMLGALYMLTRSLWAVIGLHAAWNLTQGWLFGIPVSGGDVLGLVVSKREGPEWLTGGDFGMEASLVAVVLVTAFGIGLLWLAYKRGEVRPPMWSKST